MSEIPELIELPDSLPVLPIRDLVVFPNMLAPLSVARPQSRRALEEAMAHDRLVLLLAQRDDDGEADPNGLHELGTVAMVMRSRPRDDGSTRALVQGLMRARANGIEERDGCLFASLSRVREADPASMTLESAALIRATRELVEQLARSGKSVAADVLLIAAGVSDPGRLANLLAANLPLDVREAQAVLELGDPVARLRLVCDLLRREAARLGTRSELQSEAREKMARTEREYHLREQLRLILDELGEGEGGEGAQFRQRLREAGVGDEVFAEAEKQLKRLERAGPESAEAAVARGWLDCVCELPWDREAKQALTLSEAEALLDRAHHGLGRIKERILEQLSVHVLRGAPRGPVLCFAGPPGVGKTSLARSIAQALGRPFARVSLAGVRDEAEIRGHRRTYVGAMPGRILQALRGAGARNPVLLLDEVDKLGADSRGDPAAALLEVLDPEQHHAFRDHYLDLPFDLSGVLFIATANLVDDLPPALRDRLEVLPLAGYTEDEKVTIARTHLLPRQLEETGVSASQLVVSAGALRRLAREYTREAGVRGLERQLASLARKAARRIVSARGNHLRVGPGDLERLLGPPPYPERPLASTGSVGQAIGLAWTSAGGEVLQIEAEAIRGRPGLLLTGHLGEVMKESAQAAITFARAHAELLGIPGDFFQRHEVHIHVPAAAIPKDGPSAGVTIAAAVVSLASGIPLRRDVAMTGELTLGGRVLPVGGVREKVLAAARHGLSTVIVPEQNATELLELPASIRRRLQLVPVATVEDALAVALAGGASRQAGGLPPMDAARRKC